MKIVFFISNIHLPRCVNRVNQFAENGYDVEAYYFDRTEFTNKVNALNVPTHCMGIMDSGSGSYFKRMPAQYKALRNVIKSYDEEMTIFYLFGFDMALIYYFTFSKAKYIFEESDLRHTYFKPLISLLTNKSTSETSVALLAAYDPNKYISVMPYLLRIGFIIFLISFISVRQS